MKCDQCRQICLTHDSGDLPAEATTHLLECETCRKIQHRTLALTQLLSLKNYETPDPHLETRLIAKVEAGIRDLEARPRGFLGWLWQTTSGERIPATRVAMAFAVLGLIALHSATIQNVGPLPSSSIEANRAAPAPALAADPTPTNRYFDPSLPVVFLPATSQPENVRYGNGPSRLVGFEY